MFKNSKIKKYISSILTIAIILASLTVGWVAFGDDLIPINPSVFPDENWRTIVKKVYDKNGDGFLSAEERNTERMSISGYLEDYCGEDATIEDLTGIEYFTNVQRLYVGYLGLRTLDVSMLRNLTQLTCQGNSLTTLRVGSNPNLVWINCASNELTNINIAGCYSLNRLDCYANKLETLNVLSNSSLKELYCQQNELTRLDVTSNSLLEILYCAGNHLTELNLSYNAKLSDVTQGMIGDQTTTAVARYAGSTINIPLSINRNNVVSTSLDTIEESGTGDTSETRTVLGYSATGNFFTKDVKNLKIDGHDGDAVEYEYNVNNAKSESMNVFVKVQRSFYQIDFYTNESKTELISRQIVNEGKSAIAPTIASFPEDKIFGGWIGNYENVTEDSDVYARWINEHIWRVSRFNHGDLTIHCDDCGDEYSFNFSEVLNLTEEDVYFVPVLDVVKDGILNAKDYAKLTNDFK